MSRQLPIGAQVRLGTAPGKRGGISRALWGVCVALGGLCCDPTGDPPDEVCPRARPAFELTIASLEGPLPRSLEVEVEFGGAAIESYSFQRGNVGNDVLCCVPGNAQASSLHPQTCGRALSELMKPDAALDAAPPLATPSLDLPTRVHCQLWTNGAAELTITARDTPELRRTLVADQDERYPQCSVWDTTSVKLVLGADDAGAP